MQPSTTLSIIEPLVITDAFSGDTKLYQTLPEHALMDVAQGLVRWCKDSVMQWLSLWLQQRFGAVVVEELSPTVRQQLDVIVDSFAELKLQQQLIQMALESLKYSPKCCCEAGKHLETSRTLKMEKKALLSASQEQEMDDYVELNFEDEARVKQEPVGESGHESSTGRLQEIMGCLGMTSLDA